MSEFFTTVGIMCGAAATAVALSFGYFCLRRRVCDMCCCCCSEEDVDMSESQENSLEMVNRNPIHRQAGAGYDKVDSGWFQDWSVQGHRTHDSTNDIIRKVFALPPDSPLGQEGKNRTEKKCVSPEILAIPARMTQPLGEVAVSKGTFRGDTTEHFTPIYRQSKLMSFKLSGSPPVSPHYLDSDVLRKSRSPQRSKSSSGGVRNGRSDVISPGDTSSEGPPTPENNQHNSPSPRKLTPLSSLTSATSAEASTDGVRSPERPQYQHHSQQIFTIHETCSSISDDSLMVDTLVKSGKQAGRPRSHSAVDQNSTTSSTGLNRLMGTASPKLEDPTYRGFLHSFRLDHIV